MTEIATDGAARVARILPDFAVEATAIAEGAVRVVGVDEAGRGPLAGPVVAAAVRLDPRCIPDGLDDSKRLTASRRQVLRDCLVATAEVGVGEASVDEIDALNIRGATHLAMLRALAALPGPACLTLVDGRDLPDGLTGRSRAVIGGDALVASIAAASIVAKVVRDAAMAELDRRHPGYGWLTNRGYATRAHREALVRLGPSPEHRRSFAPVRALLP